MSETDYAAGSKAATMQVLRLCIRLLGSEARDANSWRFERASVVEQLRYVCGVLGCNDWPEDLDLGDVIRKYMVPAMNLDDM